ncbi:hypothetical protein KEM54_002072 [Ascosphaera aggregata]|nr:hypothetical protein KEM54_002072 [Ascosphaera aggregata]
MSEAIPLLATDTTTITTATATATTTIPHLTVSPAETTLEATSHPTSSIPTTSAPTPSTSTSPEQATSTTSTTSSLTEKKPLKKRRSWGQELPIPKTNLPPRKRAKTEDEKEQRRIERVLRNRAAAQTSRERKRLEVEKLETEKKQVETENGLLLQRLAAMEAENRRLAEQVAQLQQSVSSASSSPSPFTTATTTTPASAITSPPNATSPVVARVRGTREESPTLSFTLFKQEHREKSSFDRLPFFPRYTPGGDDDSRLSTASAAAAAATTTSSSLTAFNETSDMTQRPAAMLSNSNESADLLAPPSLSFFEGSGPESISSADDFENDYPRSLSPLSSDGFNDMLFGDSESLTHDFAFLEGGLSFTDFDGGAAGAGAGTVGPTSTAAIITTTTGTCAAASAGDLSAFVFDSLVDFDAEPSFSCTPDNTTNFNNLNGNKIKIEDDIHNITDLFNEIADNNNITDNNNNNNNIHQPNESIPAAPGLPDAAPHETSCVQPSFGASTTRCDGQGIAAST